MCASSSVEHKRVKFKVKWAKLDIELRYVEHMCVKTAIIIFIGNNMANNYRNASALQTCELLAKRRCEDLLN